jgi:polyisoprenoid-binding protein YceI
MHCSRSRLAKLLCFLVAAPLALVALSALPQHAAPQLAAPQLHASEIVLSVDPTQSKVHWTLGTTLHAVHGTFAFKNGTLHVDPASGKASGEVVVYATSGDSGNDGRDKKMHKDVLASAQYPDIIFRPDHVEGKIATQGSFTVQVHGIFVLHGSEHELTVPVQAEFAGDRWTGGAKFDVPFIDWGLKNPSNFFLKVNHTVEVELELKGTLQNPAAP